MDLTLVLGSVAVVLSLVILWWSVAGRRADESITLAAPGDGRPRASRLDHRSRNLLPDAGERAVPALERLGARLRGTQPSRRTAALAMKIRRAGSPQGWTVERVLAAKVMGAMFLAVLLLARFLGSPSLLNFVLIACAGFFGFFLPDGLLDAKVSTRQEAIRAEVSEVIDQLAVMVRAGLSVDAAVVRCAQRNDGPLADELKRVVQEMRVGVNRTTALTNMAERVDIPELRGFVAALAQADQLGVPVSETLKVQAVEMRVKQRQAAEEMAMKLPVKILFPMVFCILPVIFIVLLGPAAIRIFEQFNG